MVPAIVIFVCAYVLIAGKRLSLLPIGRPAGALLGAAAMVVFGAIDPVNGLSPTEALRAVDLETVGLLFGMMILAAGMHAVGLFRRLTDRLAKLQVSPVGLLWIVTMSGGVASALLLNDSVCLLATPVVDAVARARRLPRVPYLLALAMGANAGSAMTLAGNPQNMLVARLSGISYRAYLLEGGIAGLVALVTTALTLQLVLGRALRVEATAEEAPPPSAPPPKRSTGTTLGPIVALVGVSAAFMAGGHLAWTAITGAALVIAWLRRDATPLFDRVSWTVLVFFAALFVLVAGLEKAGAPAALFHPIIERMPKEGLGAVIALSVALLVGCQIISNVPFILLASPLVAAWPDRDLAWMLVALVSTLAGNLTLLGSVANVIVIEEANVESEVGFWRYFKAGAPVTIASTVAGVAALLAVHALVHG